MSTAGTTEAGAAQGARVAASLRAAHALTIDVEDYFQVGVFQDRIAAADWDSFPCRVERNLDRCLELLDARGVKATFFVLGWIAERFPAALRRLAAEGHEIGSHGFGHQPIWKLDPTALREDVRRAQGAIADVLGQTPTCYRAPCFSVTAKTLWALEILHEEGIRADSSVFPVAHPEYGLPAAERRIHRIVLPSGGELVEFPMTVGRLLFKTVAFCGGGWFRLFPYRLTRRSLRASAASGEPIVFYLHPWELDPDQPRLYAHTGRLGRFRHYVGLDRTEAKLARLLDDFAFTTMGAVLDRARERGNLPIVRLAELAAAVGG